MKLKVPREIDETKNDEEPLTVSMFVFAFVSDLNAALLGYLRYAEHTQGLNRHHMKMRNSSLLITEQRYCRR